MVKAIEREKSYLPIKEDPNLNPNWLQIRKIPVTFRRIQVNHYINLTFASGALTIKAGGEDVEIAGWRIKTQMIAQLEHAIHASQNPYPYARSAFDIEQLGQYFSPRKNLQEE